jgi:hypothetical protein
MKPSCFIVLICLIFLSPVWPIGSDLRLSDNGHYLVKSDGMPFLWVGGTAWGLAERPGRSEVDKYLDNRKAKKFTVIQLCLFWGKRKGAERIFYVNPENYYGHRAFEGGTNPNTSAPAMVSGGSATSPNDFWDNVDYIVQAVKTRGLTLAILPVWGRRYVNAIYAGQSLQCFSETQMKSYGEFLGSRYKNEPHIIWVLGGDVDPSSGTNRRNHYRRMAEGIVKGVTGVSVGYNTAHSAWDSVLITYHPPGSQYTSSSYFHHEAWLDFNMSQIGTHAQNTDKIYPMVVSDYGKSPVKPIVHGEAGYEGPVDPLGIRREACHAFFGGAAGHTYGNMEGDYIWTFYPGWDSHLDSPGAAGIRHISGFLGTVGWVAFAPDQSIITTGEGSGITRNVAMRNSASDSLMVYFAGTAPVAIDLAKIASGTHVQSVWHNLTSGGTADGGIVPRSGVKTFSIPAGWSDGILLLHATDPANIAQPAMTAANPAPIRLYACPNPFSKELTLSIGCCPLTSGYPEIVIYDINGSLIQTLTPAWLKPAVTWNASGIPGGTYIARLTIGNKTITKKLTLIR